LKDMFIGPVINGTRYLMPGALQKEVFSIWQNFKQNGGFGLFTYPFAKLVSILSTPVLAAVNRQWLGGPKITAMHEPDWQVTKGLDGIISQFLPRGEPNTWTQDVQDYVHFLENQINPISLSGTNNIVGWRQNPYPQLVAPPTASQGGYRQPRNPKPGSAWGR
jgi:hypothetical protein